MRYITYFSKACNKTLVRILSVGKRHRSFITFLWDAEASCVLRLTFSVKNLSALGMILLTLLGNVSLLLRHYFQALADNQDNVSVVCVWDGTAATVSPITT